MVLTKTVKIMSIGTGVITAISGVVAVVFWLDSNLVWAGQYGRDQMQIQQFQIENRIDIQEDRLERATSAAKRRKIEKRIKRLEEQQKILDKMELEQKNDS